MNSNGAPTIRVLIVEDNPDDRELLIRQLRKFKIENNVKFISDGKEALEFLTAPNPNKTPSELIAIFLDLKLPSIDGLELLRLIKDHPFLKEIPVIVMTSSNNPKHLEECQRLKVNYFISKPITFAAFSKAVANVFYLPTP